MPRKSKNVKNEDDDNEWDGPEGAPGIPRGLQVMADWAPDLGRGFPYPKILATYDIFKNDWRTFCLALSEPTNKWGKQQGIAYEVEKILDIAAEWDVQYFRLKGLIMRLDMPGEEKYGLDFMDLYYQKGGLNRKIFNVAHGFAGKLEKAKMKESKDSKLSKVRLKGFENTRVVLEPIHVLDHKHLADAHGWTQWIEQCEYARHMRTEGAKKIVIDNKPWDFNTMDIKRVDRWPPSKHLYYDRFRGKQIIIEKSNGNGYFYSYSYFIPDPDSMDQRGISNGAASILPCDEVPRRPIRKGPVDAIFKRHNEQADVGGLN